MLVGGGELHERWETLLTVRAPLSRGIQRFTGITQAMVDEAPPAEAQLPELAAQLRGRVLVAHSASFDRRVLRQARARGPALAPARPSCAPWRWRGGCTRSRASAGCGGWPSRWGSTANTSDSGPARALPSYGPPRLSSGVMVVLSRPAVRVRIRPKRSVRIRSGSWPAPTSRPATASTSGGRAAHVAGRLEVGRPPVGDQVVGAEPAGGRGRLRRRLAGCTRRRRRGRRPRPPAAAARRRRSGPRACAPSGRAGTAPG